MRSVLLFLTHFTGLSFAQAPQLPAFDRLVIDQVGLLNPGQVDALSNLLYELHAQGGPQVGVFIAEDLQGLPIEEFSIRTVEKWKLGSEKADNGLMILVAPKEHQMRIEVGAGIEGEITDYDASQMIRQILTPAFRQEAYYEGLSDTIRTIAAKFNIQLPEESGRIRRRPAKGLDLPGWFWILLVIFVLLSRFFGPRGPRFYGGGSGWGGGGGFGGGGFGGGGFGGGGGGGFSGGGSSGSW